MKRIVCLHGVPKKIVSDRGTQFTSHFWKQLHEVLGTRLEFSTAFHPQTDGQTERVNQILEDMLRACALDYGSSWDENLPYAEFSYNNSHQASIGMAPFEALYGRKCTTPLLWSGVGERSLFGPDLIKDAEEKVRLIKSGPNRLLSPTPLHSSGVVHFLPYNASNGAIPMLAWWLLLYENSMYDKFSSQLDP